MRQSVLDEKIQYPINRNGGRSLAAAQGDPVDEVIRSERLAFVAQDVEHGLPGGREFHMRQTRAMTGAVRMVDCAIGRAYLCRWRIPFPIAGLW